MDKQAIKQIMVEQKEEANELLQSKLIPREIAPLVQKSFDDPLVKVIIGARRSGKSVLAHQLLQDKNYGYINFDDERLRGLKTSDLNFVLEAMEELSPGIRHLLLDEVQNVEGWELFVNRLKRQGYRVVVTGSNANLLSRELATHLTGRHLAIELYPFSFKEFIAYHDVSYIPGETVSTKKRARISRLLSEYMTIGAFPELPHIAMKQKYLQDLYDKMITQDIVMRYQLRLGNALKELASLALSQFGSKITYQKLARLFQLNSVHTIRKYLGYFEEVYLLFQLYPFSFKAKERVARARKVYAIDTGLIHAVSTQFSPNRGRTMENVVFIELKRRQKECYYFVDDAGYEVDFVLKEGLRISGLIQVCADMKDEDVRKRELRALLKAAASLRCHSLRIITSDHEGEERVGKELIYYTPLWKWLLEK